VLLLLTMKKEVGAVLLPTVRSTLRMPCASDAWPLKSLNVRLVLIKSSVERPNRHSTEYGIILTLEVQSLQMLIIHLPGLLKNYWPWPKVKLSDW
jgi:hypothetical protein